MSKKQANCNAPIIPGVGAADIRLYDRINTIASVQRVHQDDSYLATPAMRNTTIWNAECVDLSVLSGLVVGITVSKGYGGKVEGKIGIGSPLHDVTCLLDGWEEDECDNIVMIGRCGAILEIEGNIAAPNFEESLIRQIVVFDPSPHTLVNIVDSEHFTRELHALGRISSSELDDRLRELTARRLARGWVSESS